MAWGEKENAKKTSKPAQAITIKKTDLDMMEDEIKRFTNRLARLRSMFQDDSLTIYSAAPAITACRRASQDVSVEMRNFRLATSVPITNKPEP